MRREWIEIFQVPKCELRVKSPSMRREWIEMEIADRKVGGKKVSLHAEGVD